MVNLKNWRPAPKVSSSDPDFNDRRLAHTTTLTPPFHLHLAYAATATAVATSPPTQSQVHSGRECSRRHRGRRPVRYAASVPSAAYLTPEQATHHAHEVRSTTRRRIGSPAPWTANEDPPCDGRSQNAHTTHPIAMSWFPRLCALRPERRVLTFEPRELSRLAITDVQPRRRRSTFCKMSAPGPSRPSLPGTTHAAEYARHQR